MGFIIIESILYMYISRCYVFAVDNFNSKHENTSFLQVGKATEFTPWGSGIFRGQWGGDGTRIFSPLGGQGGHIFCNIFALRQGGLRFFMPGQEGQLFCNIFL